MTRRSVMLLPLAGRLWADAASEVWELLASMASALADANPQAFFRAFDQRTPDYETLRTNVTALVTDWEVRSSIEPQVNEGSDTERRLELDWLLELVERQDTSAVVRRHDTVSCTVEKNGRQWKVTSMRPVSFFFPPQVPQ
jgi:hypothetical protein